MVSIRIQKRAGGRRKKIGGISAAITFSCFLGTVGCIDINMLFITSKSREKKIISRERGKKKKRRSFSLPLYFASD
jgi:hypothetical protein